MGILIEGLGIGYSYRGLGNYTRYTTVLIYTCISERPRDIWQTPQHAMVCVHARCVFVSFIVHNLAGQR